MDRASVEPVARSFVRVKGDPLAQAFYQRFLVRDLEVRRMFVGTEIERQRELFLNGIYSLIDYARGGATGRMGVRRLARIHGEGGMGVTRRMYETWLACLLEALATHDPQWSPDLRLAWEQVLRVGIEALLRERV